MMRKAWTLVAALVFAPGGASAPPRKTAPAGTQAAGLSVADRAAKREQALAQLDDPDPILRMTVMEDILQSNDGVLRTLALRKALASSDGDLRQAALRGILTRGAPFTFKIETCGNTDKNAQRQNLCTWTSTQLGFASNFYFRDMNAETGTFSIFQTNAQAQSPNDNARQSRPGRVMGTSMQFNLHLNWASTSIDCSGDFELAGQRMKGRLVCSSEQTFEGEFQLI